MKKAFYALLIVIFCWSISYSAEVTWQTKLSDKSATATTSWRMPVYTAGEEGYLSLLNLLALLGSGTNHYWTYWTGTHALSGKSITASKPVCSDSNGEPAVCAGTEGVWQTALTNPLVAGTMNTGYLCTKNAATNTIDCNTATSTYQAADSDLTAIAELSCTENQIIKRNGAGAWVCGTDETSAGGSGDITDVWGCTTGNCNALTAAAGDTLDASLADSSSPFKTGNTAGLPGSCTAGNTYFDSQAKILYLCSASNTWSQVMAVGADGSYKIVFNNNTSISPAASTDEMYFEGNVLKFNENGTERSRVAGPTAGPITISGPTAARTITIADADQTLLNSTASGVQTFLTTPSLTNFGSMVTGEGTGVITALGNAVNSSGGFVTYGDVALTSGVLTGYTKGAGTVAATDTILQAIQKLDGNDDAKAPLANPQFTGVVDIPANATTDAEGEITIDTTTNQLRYYGGAQRVLSPIQSASFVITAPADTDDINIMKAPYGMTILGIDCIVQGTTSVTGQLQECTSAGASCADLDSDIVCDADGAADDGTLTDSAIAANAWLRWKTTSLSGKPTFLTVTFRYLVVAD